MWKWKAFQDSNELKLKRKEDYKTPSVSVKPRNSVKRNPDDLIWRTQLHQLQADWMRPVCEVITVCQASLSSATGQRPITDAGHELKGAAQARWVCLWLRRPAQVVTKTRTRRVESGRVKHDSGWAWQGLQRSKHWPFVAMSAIAMRPERWLDETSAEKVHTHNYRVYKWLGDISRQGFITGQCCSLAPQRDHLVYCATSKYSTCCPAQDCDKHVT